MEGILGWILVSICGGIGAISLVPILAKGSLRWPRTPAVLLVVLGGAGACILTVSLIRTARQYLLTSSGGRQTQGRVVGQRQEYVTLTHNSRNRDDTLFMDRGSSSWVRFYPVVEFCTEDGKAVRFEGSVYGSGKPWIATGSMVKVYYDRKNPSTACIGNFSELWLRPLVMSVAGVVFLVAGVMGFVAGGRVLAAALAEARSPEALERQIQDDLRESYNYSVHFKGTIDRVQTLDVRGPAEYEFVCKGGKARGDGGGGIPIGVLSVRSRAGLRRQKRGDLPGPQGTRSLLRADRRLAEGNRGRPETALRGGWIPCIRPDRSRD